MKCILKKPMNLFRNYFKCLVIIFIFIFVEILFSEEKNNWIEIHLIDTINYVEYSVDQIYNLDYPPANLFDTKLNTCWVSSENKTNEPDQLFLKIPEQDSIVLHIFSGYAKSEKLYFENCRPKTIKASLYYGLNPDGIVSENGRLYKCKKVPFEQTIHLDDTFDVHTIPLLFKRKAITDIKKRIIENYDKDFKIPANMSCYILKLEIIDVYQGSKYNDICISEIFFNDCLVSLTIENGYQNDKIYLNENENTLFSEDKFKNKKIIYSDTSAVLQIVEISDNKKWAVLISMPKEIEGRVETTYLLTDIINKKIVNHQLEIISDKYVWGDFIYFETGADNLLYLICNSNENENMKINLR